MELHVLFVISFAWAKVQALSTNTPKYEHRDPVTSELLLCDQCPPGTAVEHHCTSSKPTACTPCSERRFADQWHWGDSCRHCTSVCKERQLVRRECNSTHDRLCECLPGYHLVVEFCVPHTACPPGSGVSVPGTPESDTVCERCLPGFFSSVSSSTEKCLHQRDCAKLGLKTLRAGTATQDALCESEHTFDCSHQHQGCHADFTLCEDAMFQFMLSPPLDSVPLERLLETLPGRKVDWNSVERLKKTCSPQQQAQHLLRLWREQNKDQDKVHSIIQGVNHCERKVSRCAGLKNVTLGDLLTLVDSLPGERVSEEAVRALVLSCPSHRYVAQLLRLWKTRNGSQDLAKALEHSLRKLRIRGAPRPLRKTLKRISRVIGAASVQRVYEKMIVRMLHDTSCFKSKPYND